MSDNILYDFESGDLSLDFANTKDWHGSKNPVEKLTKYSDLIEWGIQAGLLTTHMAETLLRKEIENPDEAIESYEYAIRIRESIYRIFSSLYAKEPISPEVLDLLNCLVCRANGNLRMAADGDKIQWEWSPDINDTNLILWPVARAAAELLTSERASRVRECEDDRGCGYLFIDATKNHSRRWCSMDSCGNRAKARRHYSRLQAGEN